MRKTLGILFVSSVLLTAGAAAKQPYAPPIQGTVVDPAGKPAVGVTVLIVSRSELTTAISGAGGKFSIELTAPRRVFG